MTCPHPPPALFAWTVPAPNGPPLLCVGCTACGAVLSGAADAQGRSVGPQYTVKQSAKLETHP
jgi:hypothetical protein